MAGPKRLKIESGRKRLRLSMNQKGVVEAKSKLKRVDNKLANLRAPLNQGADAITTLMSDSFRNQADPAGIPWKELADSTIEKRMAKVKGGKAKHKKTVRAKGSRIVFRKKGMLTSDAWSKRLGVIEEIKKLDDNGTLKNSMHAVVIGNIIRFGSNVHYLGAHQIGTDRAGRNHNVTIPRRMVAPVEKRAGKWALIRRGPAEKVFSQIEKDIGRHVAL
jgi:phage gpG-like protein